MFTSGAYHASLSRLLCFGTPLGATNEAQMTSAERENAAEQPQLSAPAERDEGGGGRPASAPQGHRRQHWHQNVQTSSMNCSPCFSSSSRASLRLPVHQAIAARRARFNCSEPTVRMPLGTSTATASMAEPSSRVPSALLHRSGMSLPSLPRHCFAARARHACDTGSLHRGGPPPPACKLLHSQRQAGCCRRSASFTCQPLARPQPVACRLCGTKSSAPRDGTGSPCPSAACCGTGEAAAAGCDVAPCCSPVTSGRRSMSMDLPDFDCCEVPLPKPLPASRATQDVEPVVDLVQGEEVGSSAEPGHLQRCMQLGEERSVGTWTEPPEAVPLPPLCLALSCSSERLGQRAGTVKGAACLAPWSGGPGSSSPRGATPALEPGEIWFPPPSEGAPPVVLPSCSNHVAPSEPCAS